MAVVTPQKVEEVRGLFERAHRLGRVRHVPDIVPIDPDDEKAWLVARSQGLGGSDVSAILGLNKFEGPLAVYLSKRGLGIQDDDVDPAMQEQARWGHLLEDVVAQEFAVRRAHQVSGVRKPGVMFRHPVHKWMLATPDRLVWEWVSRGPDARVGELSAGLEIKTRSAHVAGQWKDGQVPPSVMCQVQWYLEVLGFDHYFLASLIGGQALVDGRVDRDQDFISRAIQAGERFWFQHVQAGVPPAADGTAGTTLAVQGSFQAVEGKTAQLPAVALTKLQRYKGLTALQGRVKKEKDAIANDVKMELGEAEEGYDQEQRLVTWRAGKPRTTVDVDALRTKFPEAYKAVTTEVATRTFRVARDVDSEYVDENEFEGDESEQ